MGHILRGDRYETVQIILRGKVEGRGKQDVTKYPEHIE